MFGAPDRNRDTASGRSDRFFHERGCDIAVAGRRERSAAHRAGRTSAGRYGITGAGGHAPFQNEPRDPRVRIAVSLRFERRFADERLSEFDDALQSRLERRYRLIELVAVERHSGFEAQDVACAEPGGFETPTATAIEQAVPYRRCIFGIEKEFEPVLTRVSGARDDTAAAEDRRFRARIIPQ